MRNVRINISLLLMVPLVFAGGAALISLAIFSCTRHALQNGQDPFWPVGFWTLALCLVALICGFVFVWMFLNPIRGLSNSVEALTGPVAAPDESESAEKKPKIFQHRRDDLVRFKQVSERVTELLSQRDVKRLFPGIVESSPNMRRLLSLVARIAPSDASVLILGESGTGKELIAQSLHECSERSGKPFVAVNCAGIPEGLIESELFGHENGAFTGAVGRKIGKFERAQGGTVFLDEIGDMPPSTQAKLLRVLQEKEIERLGGTSTIPIDVRFLAATNKDLSAKVGEGDFREDLYFRVNACILEIPPLRMRKEDIVPLATHFLDRIGSRKVISSTAMQLLEHHHWPGNVRELKNVIETADVLADAVIGPEHLPPEYANEEGSGDILQASPLRSDQCMDQTLAEIEKNLILSALRKAGGVQKRAAEILGIKERSLWHRIAKYEIDVSALKEEIV